MLWRKEGKMRPCMTTTGSVFSLLLNAAISAAPAAAGSNEIEVLITEGAEPRATANRYRAPLPRESQSSHLRLSDTPLHAQRGGVRPERRLEVSIALRVVKDAGGQTWLEYTIRRTSAPPGPTLPKDVTLLSPLDLEVAGSVALPLTEPVTIAQQRPAGTERAGRTLAVQLRSP
jgi:hypothetical protein